jgi:hypothetical protein
VIVLAVVCLAEALESGAKTKTCLRLVPALFAKKAANASHKQKGMRARSHASRKKHFRETSLELEPCRKLQATHGGSIL